MSAINNLRKETLVKQEDNLIRSTSSPNRMTIDELIKMAHEQDLQAHNNSVLKTVSETQTAFPINQAEQYVKPKLFATHIKFKDTDGVNHVVKKELIDMIKYDEDYDTADVIIADYDNVQINSSEYKKLVKELVL